MDTDTLIKQQSVDSSTACAAALENASPGSLIRIAPGIYREPIEINCSGTAEQPIRIEAEEGGTVVFNGAVPVEDWVFESDGIWVTDFVVTAEQNWVEGYKHLGLPIQVWVGEARLEIVELFDELVANSFCYQDGKLRIKLPAGRDPREEVIEVAREATMVTINGSHIEFSGCYITRCAATVQVGGLCLNGAHCVIEDCEFSEAAGGIGAHLDGNDATIRGNRFHHNGQMGFGMVAANCLFEGNQIDHNDLRNFCSNPKNDMHVWECGGGKVAYARNCVFRNNRFTDNLRGPALWFDIDNYRNRIDGNYFSNNGHSSIMIEISRDNVICNNIICDTLESNYSSSGILIQLSCKTRIYHNLFLRSEGYGVHLRWHHRTRDIHPYEPEDPDAFEKTHGFRQEDWMAPDGQYPTSDNDIRNNIFIDCRRGAIRVDPVSEFMEGNQSDYNFFWNQHNLHPMDGGHQLGEWQAMTGLDANSYCEKMVHFGPLLENATMEGVRYDPEGPIPCYKVPRIEEVCVDINGKAFSEMTQTGPFSD